MKTPIPWVPGKSPAVTVRYMGRAMAENGEGSPRVLLRDTRNDNLYSLNITRRRKAEGEYYQDASTCAGRVWEMCKPKIGDVLEIWSTSNTFYMMRSVP